jgi:hypothetical protein
MWSLRKPAGRGGTDRGGTPIPTAEAATRDPASTIELYLPPERPQHPAHRRIAQAAELADAMRQTGGKHRRDVG